VGLERGPLSLVSTTEELLERKSSGYGLENRDTAIGICRTDHATPFPEKLASCGRLVGVVRSRTEATEFNFLVVSSSFYCHFFVFLYAVNDI
jgi:hypothetical protein